MYRLSKRPAFTKQNIIRFVKHIQGWEKSSPTSDEVYYARFPDLRVSYSENSHYHKHGCHLEWAMGEARPEWAIHTIQVNCGASLVAETQMIQFDNDRKHIVQPMWECVGEEERRFCFYYYDPNTLEYAMQRFAASDVWYGRDFSKELGYGLAHQAIPVATPEMVMHFLDDMYPNGVGGVSSDDEKHQCWVESLARYEQWLLAKRHRNEVVHQLYPSRTT